jgi:hypothetical protein
MPRDNPTEPAPKGGIVAPATADDETKGAALTEGELQAAVARIADLAEVKGHAPLTPPPMRLADEEAEEAEDEGEEEEEEETPEKAKDDAKEKAKHKEAVVASPREKEIFQRNPSQGSKDRGFRGLS